MLTHDALSLPVLKGRGLPRKKMNNRYHDIDLVSRISTGKMASEGYRRERRARAWRIVGLVLFGALVIGSAFALTTADARLPATVDAPPGPVCPFGNATQRSCF